MESHVLFAATGSGAASRGGEHTGPARSWPDRHGDNWCGRYGQCGARVLIGHPAIEGAGCNGGSFASRRYRGAGRARIPGPSGVGRLCRERAAHGRYQRAASAPEPDPLEGQGRPRSQGGTRGTADPLRVPDDHGREHGAGSDPGKYQGRVRGGGLLRDQWHAALVGAHRLPAARLQRSHLYCSAARRPDARDPRGRRCWRDGPATQARQPAGRQGAAAGVLRGGSVERAPFRL